MNILNLMTDKKFWELIFQAYCMVCLACYIKDISELFNKEKDKELEEAMEQHKTILQIAGLYNKTTLKVLGVVLSTLLFLLLPIYEITKHKRG